MEPGGLRTQADAEGRFGLDAPTPGVYRITALGLGYVPAQRTVTVGAARITVNLEMGSVQSSIEVRAPLDDFLASGAVSVTKSPERLLDSSYSIQVVPAALLDNRQIQEIRDLYRNISGLTDSPYTSMTLRGFTQREVLFNGVRGNPYGSLENDLIDTGFSTSQGRLTNIENVEILKGPAALLYGAGEPGGVVNYVTKKPRDTPAAELSFRTGSFGQLGGHGETTGPLWKSQGVFYRAAYYQESRRTFRYNTRNENIHVAGALSWKKSETTSVGLEYEYADQELPGYRLRGVPVAPGGGWLTNREWTATEPTDFSELRSRVAQARVDHAFSPTLRLDATFRFLNFDRPERYHEPRGLEPDGRTMRRQFRDQYRANDDWSLTVNGYERLTVGGLGVHNLVFGVERVVQDWTGRFGVIREGPRGPVRGIDLFQPVYGLSFQGLYPAPALTTQEILSTRLGTFVQDRIEITPRLQAVLGGRYERMEDRGQADTPLEFTNDAWTGRAGVVFRFLRNASLFGSAANSYARPPALAQTPAANGPHEPETAWQAEGGAKAELVGGRVLATLAFYRIVKDNVLRPDPNFGPAGDNFSAVLPVGRVRNQGADFDLTGRLNDDLSIILTYSFLDSEILADSFVAAALGRPLPNAARHSAGLFARYDVRRTGTAVSLGAEALGRREEVYADIPVAGYAIWDVGLFQKLTNRLEIRAQLDNMLDRHYPTTALFAARAGVFPGSPRTFTASLHFRTLGVR